MRQCVCVCRFTGGTTSFTAVLGENGDYTAWSLKKPTPEATIWPFNGAYKKVIYMFGGIARGPCALEPDGAVCTWAC